jgi:hypothetical protein
MQLPNESPSPSTLRQESLPLRSAPQNGLEAPAAEASNQSNAQGANGGDGRTSSAVPVNEELIQRVVCDGRAIADLLADSLRQNPLANNEESNLYRIAQLAEALRNFQSPVEFTIGLVGDSGSGK